MKSEIKLKEAVLHILDSNVSMPVLSTRRIEMTEEIEVFIEKHLQKILEDGNLQDAIFTNESSLLNIVKGLASGSSNLIEMSHFISKQLFELMLKNIDIPPADILICIFDYENIEHLGILKMNYKSGYIHFVSQTDTGISNMIIKQKALLPQENQKIAECAIISMRSYNLKLLQKDYDINGSREEYWSKMFLQCRSELSNNSKLNILDKTAQKVTKKFFDEDFTKVAHARKVVSETLEDNDVIRVEDIANEVFDRNEEIKKEYIDELHKAGIREKHLSFSNEEVSRKVRNQKIKTDTGIEINFPSTYFNDTDKLEFINNIDGTISIIIKNIGKIQNR